MHPCRPRSPTSEQAALGLGCGRTGQGVRPAQRGDTVRWILAEVKTANEIFMKPKELSCACPCCLQRP